MQSQLQQLNLPIGWVRAQPSPPSASEITNNQVVPDSIPALWNAVTFHFFGWLITALAATLGAPFWFDTLSRFISIRSAGKVPEDKPKTSKEDAAPKSKPA